MRVPVFAQRQRRFTPEWFLCRVEELLYRLLIVPLVAFLPAPLAYRIACLRGDWRSWLDRSTHQRIVANLLGLFGTQLSSTERHRVARDFFRLKSCQTLDGIRLLGTGRALARLVEIRGLEHLKQALAAGKGAVLCIGHFGSYYSCCSLLGASGFPLTDVGNWHSNPLEALFARVSGHKLRPPHLRRPNIEPRAGQVEAAMLMADILRANEVISIAIDVPVSPQDRPHALPVEFLGRQVLLLPGSVSIAQHTGSQVLVAVASRAPDWWHQVLEIVPVPLLGDLETDFKRCVALVEAPIRQHLAHWEGCVNTQALIEFGLLSTDGAQ